VRVSSAFVRDFIECLGWDAEDALASFSDTLKAARRARFSDTTKGRVLIGTASGGTSVQYSLPQIGSYSAQDVAEAGEAIARAVDAIRVVTPDIVDTDLIRALLARFPSIRSVREDFSCGIRR